MNQPQEKKSNYVNVNLNILKSIFANHDIPVVCPKKWSETVGISVNSDGSNLVLLSINILEGVFANNNLPIPVSRKWLETLYVTIGSEVAPIQIEPASYSVSPVNGCVIPDLSEATSEESVEELIEEPVEEPVEKEEQEEEIVPSGAVRFGSSKPDAVTPQEVEEVEEIEEKKDDAPKYKTAYSTNFGQ